jgi:site-specific recombinase XerD
MNGVSLGGDLVRVVHGGRAAYKPMLENVARKKGRQRAVIRVRTARAAPPVLAPGQIDAICDACATIDPACGQWSGRVRDRLLWSLLAESGLRLVEALGLQHRDWHTGRGDTPFVEVVVGAGNSVTAVDLVFCAWPGTGKFGIRLHGCHAVRHF